MKNKEQEKTNIEKLALALARNMVYRTPEDNAAIQKAANDFLKFKLFIKEALS